MSTQVKTILSNDQMFVEVAKVAFDSVDTDRSGQIDALELEKVMAQIASDMGAEAPSKEDVAEVLEHLDTDKSGKISFEEFKVLIKDVLECMLEDEEAEETLKENFVKK
jgi:Ca2+-binding EF-hand superfamily protein